VSGFGVCLVRTLRLITLALCLERRGGKHCQFVNLAWVMGCWSFFISGICILVQIIGEAVDRHITSPPGEPERPQLVGTRECRPAQDLQPLWRWTRGQQGAAH